MPIILTNTDTQAFVKISASDGDQTLNFEDLLLKEDDEPVQTLTEDPRMSIRIAQWAGKGDWTVELQRGGEHVLWFTGSPQGALLFEGSPCPAETHNNDKPMEFKCSGDGDIWLLIRKTGYKRI